MKLKLKHAATETNDVDVFGFSIDNALNMNVSTQSKVLNLVSYALENFSVFSVDKIIWWSKHGNVAKTVACAETFKQRWLDCMSSKNSNPVQLNQLNQVYLQKCQCTVPNTDITCIVEEPAIAILLSKFPIPTRIDEQNLQNSLNFTGNFAIDEVPISSRRRFETYSKVKRQISITKPSDHFFVDRQNLPNDDLDNNNVDGDSNLKESLFYQSSRFAPALTNVNLLFSNQKLNVQNKTKRRKLKCKNTNLKQ